MSTLSHLRRLYHHMLNGGSITPDDISMVIARLEGVQDGVDTLGIHGLTQEVNALQGRVGALRDRVCGDGTLKDELRQMPGILDGLSPEQLKSIRESGAEAEAPCDGCGNVILAGGCPTKHPYCPQFQNHKEFRRHFCCCGSARCEEGPPPDCAAEWKDAP